MLRWHRLQPVWWHTTPTEWSDMDIKLETKTIAEVEAEAVVVLGFEDEGPTAGGDAAKELYATGEFTGKALGNVLEIAILHRPQGMKPIRLSLTEVAKRTKYESDR